MRQPKIISNPNVMMGKPIIAGTRITVEHILELLAGGRTIDQILEAHPHITFEDVQAALTYAAESVRIDHTYPLDQAAS
ncbi:MAG TPA: DUF433 domain-containing protein [Ktedonobacteraceae bacterium]|jgi:uncharacterized protein (DUF433 family)|nr:DUF433 domain-containing protein [Ktedonobacteraceae bacterium]